MYLIQSDFDNRPKKTGETEETGKTDVFQVSNDEFLRVIYSELALEEKAFIVSFAGNPNTPPRGAWGGLAWPGINQEIAFRPETNSYFSLASFLPDKGGKYHRQKQSFCRLHAVMLDDIGSKVSRDRLSIPPSWLIETSTGNFQAGYLLSEPIRDHELADRLMKAIIAAELCDPGANGPQTRLARLPIGVNGKTDPAFSCQLIEWRPNKRFHVNDLIAGFQLDLSSTGRLAASHSKLASNQPEDGDPVWIPKPTQNAVLVALSERGLYKTSIGVGKHDVSCPWRDLHKGGIDHGSAYFEPCESWPVGGFKCLHGHCAERSIKDLLQFLGVDSSQAQMRPTIRMVPGEMPRIVDAAEKELASSGHYYQHGGLIVSIGTNPDTKEPQIRTLSPPSLLKALSSVASWVRHYPKSDTWVRADPVQRYVNVIYDNSEYRHLPVLAGLAHQPHLRDDGKLVVIPGYDPETKLYGHFDPNKFRVPDGPTKADANSAAERLIDLLKEFDFASDADFSAGLSALLTATIRPSLPLAPMFHVRAHAAGSGKSYLCELISAFATQRRNTPMTFPGDDEECRKLLLAELLQSPPAIEFDNLTTDLVPYKSLCTALTSEHLGGRILGVSKTATVTTRTLFLSSGNNVGPVKDMARRSITIQLAPQCEFPDSREFRRPNLVQEVFSDRERFVSDALTIVLAWIQAGEPKAPCRTVASYGRWSDLCRQPLLWLGLPDPAHSLFQAVMGDPDRDILGSFMSEWHLVFGSSAVTVKQVIRKVFGEYENHGELRELIRDLFEGKGEIKSRSLGRWLSRHEGRIVHGLRIRRAGSNGQSETWIVEKVAIEN